MYILLAISLILLTIPTAIAIITATSLIVFSIVKVPYVQTPKKGVNKMFELAKIKPNEKVYDLGCGNGNLVFKAEKEFKANAIGFELSPWPYFLARSRKILKKYKSEIYFKNFLKQDISDADVIFCFLLPIICARLSQKINLEFNHKKTRIVSYGFKLPNLKDFILKEKWYNKNTPIYLYQAQNSKHKAQNKFKIKISKFQKTLPSSFDI